MLPRVETEQGWRIQWKALFPGSGLETALNGFGITSMKISRTQTLPPPSMDPAPSLRLPRFRSARPGEVMIDIAPSEALGSSTAGSSEGKSDLGTHIKGNALTKYKSDSLVLAPSRGHVSPSGQLSSTTTRASSGNFGRVAAPIRSAASLQSSALLTGTILPERDAHTTTASRQPSLLAIAPSGELFPAPAGSMPYDILPNVFSLDRGRSLPTKGSIRGLDLNHQIQQAAEQAMRAGSNAATPSADPLSPALSMRRLPSAMPAWMEPTIEEDVSYHPSVRVSYSGPYGQAAREEEARAEAGDVIAAAAAKLVTVAEADESRRGNKSDGSSSGGGTSRQGSMKAPVAEAEPTDAVTLFAGYGAFTASNSETANTTRQASIQPEASGVTNLFAGYGAFTNSGSGTGNNSKQVSRRGSAMLRLASSVGAHELAALAALTGDFSALWDLAPVTNSPFIAADQAAAAGSPRPHGSPAVSSPRPPPSPSSQLTSPGSNKKVSFEAASPFMQMNAPPPDPPLRSHSIPSSEHGNYRDQSIRIENFEDSFYLTDSVIFNEQTALEEDFFSPFAAIAEDGFDPGKLSSNASRELGTPVQKQRSTQQAGWQYGHLLETAPSSASQRVLAARHQLLDIAATLTPMASAALRTQSVLVVPVMPASIFDHSIASKPSFEASPPAPRDYTYIIVTAVLILGLIGCSFAEKYLQ